MPKKDLGLLAMVYGNVYVASIAFGAKDAQTVKAFLEAEAYPGPSLLIAYSHCIAHGYDMAFGTEQQKLAVDSGVWPLYRFDPRRAANGQPPLQLDCAAPKVPVQQFMRNENRFRMVERMGADRARELAAAAQRQAERRFHHYQQLATLSDAAGPAGEKAGV
jgi:pyruvate-ferredoxin/flavodoxin oxidoreductase